MGFLKKIFRAPRKFVRKVIPKEIRPFAPYIAAGMIGPAGLPALGLKQGLSRALLAGLTRGVVDDEADFRDVLRTGVTAALPNIIKGGSEKLGGYLTKNMPTVEAIGPAEGASRIVPGFGNLETAVVKGTPISGGAQTLGQKFGTFLQDKVAGSDMLEALTNSGINKEKVGAVITAGSMDQARKLISDYEEGLDGAYDRKNDRGALFKIFEKAQWGTDDEINDMLDRYGYMGGGSVMPMQTGIAGALPIANTRPGYDTGGGIKMASAVLGGEEDDIAMELFGKPYKDLNPAEIQEFQEEMDRLQKKFMKKDSKENMLMASNEYNQELLESLFEKYLEMGLSPKDAADKARQEFDQMSKAKESDRMTAQEGGLMNLGGNEMDLRGGGFVPLGAKEKADDVPARLSKNEFVFTADAVRAAGGGSVDRGADIMYKTMKNLENKVA